MLGFRPRVREQIRRRWSRSPLATARRAWAYLNRRQAALRASRDPYGPLSVGELVLHLQRFDPDLRVVMPGEFEDWTDVHEAHLDIFSPQRRDPSSLELADDGDPRAIFAVRLFGSPDA